MDLSFIKNNGIIKNSAWIIVSKIIQSLLGLVISSLTSRYLGPSNYGIINYAASVISFVTPIVQLGLTNILVQELTNSPENEGKIIGTATLMSLLSSIVCIAGITLFSITVNSDDTTTAIVTILYSTILIGNAFDLIQYWYQSKLLSKWHSIASFIAYIIVSIYKVLLLLSGKNVYWFAISNSFDLILIAIIMYVVYFRITKNKLSFSKDLARRMFSKSKFYIISSMMVVIFASTDKIMIKHLMGNEYTGLYSAALNCANLTQFVFVAIIDSFRPVIFNKKKEGNLLEYEKYLRKLYFIIFYLSLAQCLFMTIFAKPLIILLYGDNYLSSINTLRLIVWYTTFSFIGSIRNIWILSENKQKYLWIINLSGALLNILLNLFFIKTLGINGAALASLITQIFTNIIISWIIKPISYSNKLLFKGINPKNLFNLFKKNKQ